MDPFATSMAAHRPFAIRPVTVSISSEENGQTKITVTQANKTANQLHHGGTDEVKAKKPAATAPKRQRRSEGPLVVYADKNFKLTSEVLEKIKTSDPLKPINMPIISLKTSQGNMKVFIHCQTTRLYNQETGIYIGDLAKIFPAANEQLAEAMRERRERNGPSTADQPAGMSYSSVLKPDEVLAGEE